jgi:putative polyhydroxyalkanoate system protein
LEAATMAVIDIHRMHGCSLKDVRAAVERVARTVSREHGFAHKWEGDTLEFSRAGAKGSIRIAKHDVHIHVELGFLMSALKPVIEGEIVRKLDK